jgi:hypothetical protein
MFLSDMATNSCDLLTLELGKRLKMRGGQFCHFEKYFMKKTQTGDMDGVNGNKIATALVG